MLTPEQERAVAALTRGLPPVRYAGGAAFALAPPSLRPPPGTGRTMDPDEKMARLEADQIGDIQAGRTPREAPELGGDEDAAVSLLERPRSQTPPPAPTVPPPAPQPGPDEQSRRVVVQAILKSLGADLPDLALTAGTNEEFLLEFNKAVAPVALAGQAGKRTDPQRPGFQMPDLLRAQADGAEVRGLTS
jgi:hypothetical protein